MTDSNEILNKKSNVLLRLFIKLLKLLKDAVTEKNPFFISIPFYTIVPIASFHFRIQGCRYNEVRVIEEKALRG